jgi:ABC-type bacteriocin/lantibiotic exporter with double-glycine peptidase domain
MVVSALLQLPTPLLTKYLVDTVIPSRDLGLLNLMAAALVAFFLGSQLVNYIEKRALISYRTQFEQSLRTSLFDRLMAAPLPWLERESSGYLQSRMDSDVGAVGGLLMDTVASVLIDVLTFVVGVVLLFHFHLTLAILSLLAIPLFVVLLLFFAGRINLLAHDRQELWARLRGTEVELLKQARTIKAFNRVLPVRDRFTTLLSQAIGSSRRLQMTSVLSGIAIGFGGAALPILVIWYGIREIIVGNFTVGGFIAFNGCLGYLFSPVQRLATLNLDLQAALASAERVLEVLGLEDEKTQFGQLDPGEITSVELRDVSFHYPGGGGRGLDAVALSLHRGETVAVLGETGTGKSTITRLMLGLDVPQRGELLVNGRDYRAFDLAKLREHIGYVPQEPELLAGTLSDNLTFFSGNGLGLSLPKVIEWCELEGTIARLPQRLDTPVHEAGAGLSGGEKQRVAIARAVLRRPDVLILDEATSALDAETEARLVGTLAQLPWRPALLVVTHRTAFLAHANHTVTLG